MKKNKYRQYIGNDSIVLNPQNIRPKLKNKVSSNEETFYIPVIVTTPLDNNSKHCNIDEINKLKGKK